MRIERKEMKNNESDIFTVANVKKRDDVLFVGNSFINGVENFARTFKCVKNENALYKLSETRQFDRIFACDTMIYSLESIVRLSRPAYSTQDTEGLVCFTSSNSQRATEIQNIIESFYPSANIWTFCLEDKSFVVMTDAKGYPDAERMQDE